MSSCGQRLSEAGLTPSPEADRAHADSPAFLRSCAGCRRPRRRRTLLPPTSRPDAWGALVERLLASPHYGERMATPWLDVVRYADTIGYHSDNPRNVWPYRDYVIRAFNDNKPFDRFTIEQIAGDLLPGSTDEQKVASRFQPARAEHGGRRRAAKGLRAADAHRPRARHRHRLPGRHHRLRAVPRPQVRPDHPARLLLAWALSLPI